jgi:hypothetical protein
MPSNNKFKDLAPNYPDLLFDNPYAVEEEKEETKPIVVFVYDDRHSPELNDYLRLIYSEVNKGKMHISEIRSALFYIKY